MKKNIQFSVSFTALFCPCTLSQGLRFCAQKTAGLAIVLLCAGLVMCGGVASGQNVSATWGANSNNEWYQGGNWAGGSYAGVQGTAAANSNVATFTSAYTGTTPNINMGTASLNLGAISIDNTRTTALTVSNNNTTAGQLRLYGATVNGVANTILRNNGAGLLTLLGLQTGTMDLVLGNTTNNIINIDNSGGITISSTISGANPLTKTGSGTGILELTGQNTYTGTTTVSGGTLRLNRVGIPGSTLPGTNSVVVNSGGTLRISTFQSLNNVTVNEGGTLILEANLSVNGSFLVNGTLQINAGAFIGAKRPTYGSNATLVYNTGGVYGRSNEWSATTGAGFPANVQISNNTTLNLGFSESGGLNGAEINKNTTLSSNIPRAISGNLTIDAGATLSMNIADYVMTASLTVPGNVNINGTLSLSSNTGGDINVSGNWTEGAAATFNANAGNVFLNGTGTQTISRTSGTNSFPRLQLGKANGSVALSNNVTVSSVLTFQSSNTANISTGSNSLIVSNNSAAALVRTGSGHVIGNFQRAIATGANTYLFGVGTSEGYTPVSLEFGSVTTGGNITVNSNDANHPNFSTYGLSGSRYVGRHWNVQNSGLAGFNVTATFTYLPGDLVGGATQANIRVARFDGSTWTLASSGTGTNSFSAALVALGGFMGGEPNPDYSITTTGNAIVITDNAGNGETLAVSQNGSNIRFAAPTTRTYSINGGPAATFTTPADVAVSGINSITI
ncbi:MAG: hypothetical protein EAY75_04060, partial [Bacteroidetes bacterium]